VKAAVKGVFSYSGPVSAFDLARVAADLAGRNWRSD
jgi:hypothetical protein